MGSVIAKEIPEVQGFFNELWSLYKKYYLPEANDEYWNAVVYDFTELQHKYNNVNVAKNVISAVLYDDLDVRYRGCVADETY